MVRRTAEICLFDATDEEILNAKVGLFEEGHKNYGKHHRFMSNNSIYFEEKPTLEYLTDVMERVKVSAEPGFINAAAAKKRRPNFDGVNPCSEILLSSNGVCNLSEINVMAFVNNGEFDVQGFYNAIEIATRIGVRMTLLDLELPEWDKIQKRDRLTGVSLTGLVDAIDAMGWENEEIKDILGIANAIAKATAAEYAFKLRIPEPLLVTTIKPSGTISQLPTVSSGAHRGYAPYYIRRVRITSTDPLAKVMLDLGFPVYPETGQGPTAEQFNKLSTSDRYAALEKANTWVIEFPIKTAVAKPSSEETAVEQYQRYQLLQKSWTDHNTSITISVGNDEWNDITEAIYNSWDDYIGVSTDGTHT